MLYITGAVAMLPCGELLTHGAVQRPLPHKVLSAMFPINNSKEYSAINCSVVNNLKIQLLAIYGSFWQLPCFAPFVKSGAMVNAGWGSTAGIWICCLKPHFTLHVSDIRKEATVWETNPAASFLTSPSHSKTRKHLSLAAGPQFPPPALTLSMVSLHTHKCRPGSPPGPSVFVGPC